MRLTVIGGVCVDVSVVSPRYVEEKSKVVYRFLEFTDVHLVCGTHLGISASVSRWHVTLCGMRRIQIRRTSACPSDILYLSMDQILSLQGY